MDQTKKRENFVRIAERRTNEIIDKITSFRNFTNESFYSYTNEDIDKIVTAIKETVENYIEPLRKEAKSNGND